MSQGVDGFIRGDAAVIGPQLERLLAQGQQVTLQISGDSMRPTLKPRRDAAVVAPLTDWPPRRGDILLFVSSRSASGYTLHRVRRVTGAGVWMNGDAQQWVEGPVPREQVLAKAVALIRKGKPVDITRPSHRAYLFFWRFTRPVRRPLFACWRALKRLAGSN